MLFFNSKTIILLKNGLLGVLFLLCCSFFLGCNKPNPNPELLDPIYADIEKQIKETESQKTELEKSASDFEEALTVVKPQTGQIKYARKRLYDSSAALEKVVQQLEYLKIHLNTRLKQDRADYLKAFDSGKPWPDPSEFASYREHIRMDHIGLKWDVKQRIENSKPQVKKKTEEGHE